MLRSSERLYSARLASVGAKVALGVNLTFGSRAIYLKHLGYRKTYVYIYISINASMYNVHTYIRIYKYFMYYIYIETHLYNKYNQIQINTVVPPFRRPHLPGQSWQGWGLQLRKTHIVSSIASPKNEQWQRKNNHHLKMYLPWKTWCGHHCHG